MTKIGTATRQSLKSGSSGSRSATAGFAISPGRPPTSGWRSANAAAAIEPVMATTNSSRSVTTTPHRPAPAEYSTVMPPATSTVVYLSSPSSTPPILIAASVTAAMIITLKNTPRYSARNPRRKAAGRPE